MNASSISLTEGPVRVPVENQFEFQEARLWDRARSNLMLLYGGRREGASTGRGGASPCEDSFVGKLDLKF